MELTDAVSLRLHERVDQAIDCDEEEIVGPGGRLADLTPRLVERGDVGRLDRAGDSLIWQLDDETVVESPIFVAVIRDFDGARVQAGGA